MKQKESRTGVTREPFRSVRLREFKRQFTSLPAIIQKTAVDKYRNYFLVDPYHPLLGRHTLDEISDAPAPSIAVELSSGYQAVAFHDKPKNTYVWYWCGSHADYDRRFKRGR